VKLYSYVVARDYGFAPNPFFNFCTLATCKPEIRRLANVGDWVVGTGSASRKRKGYVVFAMKVSEAMSFDDYWKDQRFQVKKPNLRGSKKQAFGDNIYAKDSEGKWTQSDSHHSLDDGSPNPANIINDTQADRVLIGTEFVYYGGAGPQIPERFRNFRGFDVCAGRGHKSKFPDRMVIEFVGWIQRLGRQGFAGKPIDWIRTA
jgi:hypothetical protein